MLVAELVSPGDALIARTESEGALATITTNNVGQGVGLCAVDRRVGTVTILELRVDGMPSILTFPLSYAAPGLPSGVVMYT